MVLWSTKCVNNRFRPKMTSPPATKSGNVWFNAPPNIIEKIENFGQSTEQLTLSTVKGFLQDSRKSKFKILIK